MTSTDESEGCWLTSYSFSFPLFLHKHFMELKIHTSVEFTEAQ